MGPDSLRDGLPPAVHLAGKAGAALVHATLVVTAVGLLAALAGGVDLTIGRWPGLAALLVSGVLIFSSLPDWVSQVAAYLPTNHFGQLGYRMVMPDASVAAFTGSPVSPVWVHALWVAGSAVALAALALIGARREAVTRRG